MDLISSVKLVITSVNPINVSDVNRLTSVNVSWLLTKLSGATKGLKGIYVTKRTLSFYYLYIHDLPLFLAKNCFIRDTPDLLTKIHFRGFSA